MDQVYGWLSLRNKLGLDEFSDVDERVAVSLGVHAGVAYENALLLDGLRHRVAAVERELHEAPSRVREEERSSSPERSTTGWDKRWRP